jgi:hypothetical protein
MDDLPPQLEGNSNGNGEASSFFEIAGVFARLDYVSSVIINVNHSIN